MPTLHTIGHSSRPLPDLVALLQAHHIELLADVRRFPGSRRQPRFARESLEPALAEVGIGYRHFEGLGGRRRGRLEGSPNGGWRVESFNAYADHMFSEEFQHSLAELTHLATTSRTAIMCSEAVPWRCHRRLIADALIARGWTVADIFTTGPAKEHKLTEFARVVEGEVIYPRQEE